jgi:hypothetical protein
MMSIEGKEERKINEFVVCLGINQALTFKNCERCEHFAGVQITPITNAITKEKIREEKRVLCKYPRVIPVNALFDMEE